MFGFNHMGTLHQICFWFLLESSCPNPHCLAIELHARHDKDFDYNLPPNASILNLILMASKLRKQEFEF